MTHRFSRNGRSPTPHEPDAGQGEYVKNEVDLKLEYINDLWQKLEKKLLQEQPPRRIACNYHTEYVGEDGDVEERHYLGIQRHSGKWRICYAVTWDKTRDDKLPWKPLLECDADTRMGATSGIADLKHQVAMTRVVFIPALDSAIDKLERGLLDEDEE